MGRGDYCTWTWDNYGNWVECCTEDYYENEKWQTYGLDRCPYDEMCVESDEGEECCTEDVYEYMDWQDNGVGSCRPGLEGLIGLVALIPFCLCCCAWKMKRQRAQREQQQQTVS